jgi:hypothetical protein
MRYIFAKVKGGEKGQVLRDSMIDIISLEFIEEDKFDLSVFNKFIKDKSVSYPIMNNSDYNTMMNLGRTLVYVERENVIPTEYFKPQPVSVMIIDIKHEYNKEINAFVEAYIRNKKIELCLTK